MSRLVLSAKFDKPAGYTPKTTTTPGSANMADYNQTTGDAFTVGRNHEDVVAFPPVIASTRTGANTLRFQGGGNGVPFVFRIAFKSDDAAWKLGPVRVFQGFGDTPQDSLQIPVGTAAVSIIRMDTGSGAVGYCLDLEI